VKVDLLRLHSPELELDEAPQGAASRAPALHRWWRGPVIDAASQLVNLLLDDSHGLKLAEVKSNDKGIDPLLGSFSIGERGFCIAKA